jgi:hypothetical protein
MAGFAAEAPSAAGPADDDVIVHRNAERPRHRDDLPSHLDVGLRRPM